VETRSWRERAESELEVLAVARKLAGGHRAAPRCARRHDPRTARRALVPRTSAPRTCSRGIGCT
jgi:hypothetical protein